MNTPDSESIQNFSEPLQNFLNEAAKITFGNLDVEAKDIPEGYHAKFRVKDANPENTHDNLILDSDNTLVDDTFIYVRDSYARITNKETYKHNVRRINDSGNGIDPSC